MPQYLAGYTNASAQILQRQAVHNAARRDFEDDFLSFQGVYHLSDAVLCDPKYRLGIPPALINAIRDLGSADSRQNAPLDANGPNMMTRDAFKDLLRLRKEDHPTVFG